MIKKPATSFEFAIMDESIINSRLVITAKQCPRLISVHPSLPSASSTRIAYVEGVPQLL